MRGVFFPLGGIQFEENKWDGNMWREMKFALHLLKQAVNPELKLEKCIRNWSEIAKSLAESPRQRKPQMVRLNCLS